MKKVLIILLLIFATSLLFGQVQNSILIKSSSKIPLDYRPQKEIRNASITFLKYKPEEYGIQLQFAVDLMDYILVKKVTNFNPLQLNFSNNKDLTLTNIRLDTSFTSSEQLIRQITYIADVSQFTLLKDEMLTKIVLGNDLTPVIINIKRKSQNLLNVAARLF